MNVNMEIDNTKTGIESTAPSTPPTKNPTMTVAPNSTLNMREEYQQRLKMSIGKLVEDTKKYVLSKNRDSMSMIRRNVAESPVLPLYRGFQKGAREVNKALLGDTPKTIGEAKERGVIPVGVDFMNANDDDPIPEDTTFIDPTMGIGATKRAAGKFIQDAASGLMKGSKSAVTFKDTITDAVSKSLQGLKHEAPQVGKQLDLEKNSRLEELREIINKRTLKREEIIEAIKLLREKGIEILDQVL